MNRTPITQAFQPMLTDELRTHGPVTMGAMASYTWRHDPKHLLFSMARYKFCAKMLAGKSRALEIGCGDGFCLPMIQQGVPSIVAVDVEPEIIAAHHAQTKIPGCEFLLHDFVQCPLPQAPCDAAYSLDVIEHIAPTDETAFMRHVCASLTPHAVCIVGTPNATADAFASDISRLNHVNTKNHDSLRALFAAHFYNVFLFSMNDEVVHTGFYPMAHYLFVVGVGVSSAEARGSRL